jgi:hypothetical protein
MNRSHRTNSQEQNNSTSDERPLEEILTQEELARYREIEQEFESLSFDEPLNDDEEFELPHIASDSSSRFEELEAEEELDKLKSPEPNLAPHINADNEIQIGDSSTGDSALYQARDRFARKKTSAKKKTRKKADNKNKRPSARRKKE